MSKRKTAVVPEWFDEYYQRCEYYPDEEKLETEWLSIKPELDGEGFPSDLEEFFRDTRFFFDKYRTVCENHGIPVAVETPPVPDCPEELKYFSNDRYVSIKKDVVRAVVSLLENYDLLGMPASSFLRADDEGKLEMVEKIKEDEALQLMLIEYVGLRVDLENIVELFKELSRDIAKQKKARDGRPDPINPWLAEVILKYRKAYSDDTIRAAYKSFCERVPDKSWEDFLADRAMLHESRCNPFIMTDLKDCDLPDETKVFLSARCAVSVVADLLQITVEEYQEIFEDTAEEVSKIEDYLQKYGLHLYHSDRSTYKLPFPKI